MFHGLYKDFQLNLGFFTALLNVVEVLNFVEIREVLHVFGCCGEHVLLAALDEEVVDGHEDLAGLGDPVASLLGDLVSLGKQVSLVLVDVLHLLLLCRHVILQQGLFGCAPDILLLQFI